MPVAVSPMLPGKSDLDPNGYRDADATRAAQSFFSLLGKAQIRDVMLQDSVGAKPDVWNPAKAAPYLAALKVERPRNDMVIWSNVESFETTSGPNTPCEPKRFESQIAATQGFPRVTFDFFHYMNGVVSLDKWRKGDYMNLHYLDRMKALHDWYRDTYVKPPNLAPCPGGAR